MSLISWLVSRRLWAVMSVSFVVGCASVPSQGGFADVRTAVVARTGAQIQWNQSTAADSAVTQRINALLAQDVTADAAVQVALLNNRELQALYEELGVSQAELVQAGLLQNPLLGGAMHFARDGVTNGFSLSLVQNFVSLFQRPLRRRVAAATFEETKLNVSNAVVSAAARTRAAFYDVQSAEQLRELRATVTEAARLAAELAQRQHDAGNIADLDLAVERDLYEQAKLDLADAEASVVLRREALTALMGLWGTQTQWHIATRLPDIPTQPIAITGLESAAIEHRLDLAAARQAIVVAANAAGLTRVNALVPQLDIGATVERDVEGGRSIGPSVDIQIPVFDQGQARNAAAAARVRQAQARYTALAVEIRSEVRSVWTEMEAARKRANYLHTVVIPLRTKIVDETQLQYNGMLVGVFQLLQAKRAQIEAGHQYIEALQRYWTARTNMERTIGTPFPEMH